MILAVVRHAKAEKARHGSPDEHRPLAALGLRQAAYLAERFAAHSVRPDAIVASAALRTRGTAAAIAAACGVDFDFDDRLFIGRQTSDALEVIAERPHSRFLMLVGHNDQVSDIVLVLTRGLGRGGDPADSGRFDPFLELATGQAVLLDVPLPSSPVGSCTILDSWRLRPEEQGECEPR